MFQCKINDVDYQLIWYHTIDQIKSQLKDVSLEEIAEDYYVFKAKVFRSEKEMMVGLHFAEEQLAMIELYYDKDIYKAEVFISTFNQSRMMLIEEYGEPLKESNIWIQLDGLDEKTLFQNGYWETEYSVIEHDVMDRFGPEEHILITPAEGV